MTARSPAALLVVENDPLLPGTGRLGAALERSGLPVARRQAWREPVADHDPADRAGIVVMGGEMHAWDDERCPYLPVEVELLRAAVAADVPVLGICLGGQLLARALGSRVYPAPALEGGWLPIEPVGDPSADPVLGHLTGPTGVFSWHVDVFDLPAGAEPLARSAVTRHQAFRFGRAWGLQFHPEVDGPLFDAWLAGHPALEMDAAAAADLRAQVTAGFAASASFIDGLFDRFLAVAGGAARRPR
jgi:GMP synthase (glutamine-hydrolysing)